MINLKDLGLAGDGITNDAPALQAAINGGGSFYFPEGNYSMEDQIKLAARTHVHLEPGARVVRRHPWSMWINGLSGDSFAGYNGKGHITLDGTGVMDMNGVNVPDQACCISSGHGHDLLFQDFTILDTPLFHAFEMNSSERVQIKNVKMLGYVNTDGNVQKEAIQLDIATQVGFGAFGLFDNTPCRKVLIEGCSIGPSGTPGSGSWPRGIGSHGGGNSPAHSDIKVINNFIYDCDVSGVYTYYWSRSEIMGNTISGSGSSGLVVKDYSQHVTVAHNQVFDSGATGIWINNQCGNITVHGNDVIGYSQNLDDKDYGIRASGGCKVLFVSSNRVRNFANGPRGHKGLSFASGLTEIVSRDNVLTNSGHASGTVDSFEDLSSPGGNHAGNVF